MNRDELLRRIRAKARRDAENRLDPRFRQTMGFLVAKGFLQTNYRVPKLPNQRLKIEDAIWAGENVEPRILEVLPAAVLRLERHFDFDPKEHKDLVPVLEQLRQNLESGSDFHGIPYKKIKAWINLKLRDGRTKLMGDKKIMKTFRLTPKAVEVLELAAQKAGRSVTEELEARILHSMVG